MVFVHKGDVRRIKEYIDAKLKDQKATFDINEPVNKVIIFD
jgi:hypothetical protein